MDMSLSELQELVMDREVWRAAIRKESQRVRHDWVTELNYTELSHEETSTYANDLSVCLFFFSMYGEMQELAIIKILPDI